MCIVATFNHLGLRYIFNSASELLQALYTLSQCKMNPGLRGTTECLGLQLQKKSIFLYLEVNHIDYQIMWVIEVVV